MKQFLKQNALLLIGFFMIMAFFFTKIKNLFSFNGVSNEKPKSSDALISSVIELIDNSIDSWGTFDSDHEPIFEALKKLSKAQLLKLYSDFGLRYYNPLTRTYKLFDNFGFRGYSQSKDLNSLFISEFSETQIIRLKKIYTSKGLVFPV